MGMYSIKFNTNCELECANLEVKGKKAIPALPVLAKDGYKFIGWFKDKELENAFDLEKMPKNDIELYAKWEAITLDEFLHDIDFFTKSANILQNLQNDYTEVPNFKDPDELAAKKEKKATKKKSTTKKKTTSKKKSTTKKKTTTKKVKEEKVEVEKVEEDKE